MTIQPKAPVKKPSRIQKRNRKRILDAALEVFSAQGFRGATLDQIASEAGLSKPNVLYYFDSKEAIHATLVETMLDTWLDPLRALDPDGVPRDEILSYVRRKLAMSRDFPRESRLFANEILQGAPRILPALEGELKALVDEKAAVIAGWAADGRIARVDPYHLMMSIWAVTQHYADFDAQVRVIVPPGTDSWADARAHTETLFSKLLEP
jgi:TetR/AcrR family transcriptional regulator